MNQARRTDIIVTFDGVEITEDIRNFLTGITYIDSEEDNADDLQLTLQDRDNLWMQSWLQQAMEASSTTKAANATAAGAAYTVTAKSGLILRAAPSKESARLNCFAFGTPINVLDASGSWFQVDAGGQSGYMWGGYLAPAAAAQTADSAAQNASGQASTAAKSHGFLITAAFHRENWDDGHANDLNCGQFELDTIQCSGPPDVVTLKATALPYSGTARQTEKSKTWENYMLSGIGTEIATGAGMAFMFESDTDILYTSIEQKDEADIPFLLSCCHDAGLSLKISNNMIIIFDQVKYEAKDSVMTITKGDGSYKQHNLSTTKANVQYTSCRVSYVTPEGIPIEGIYQLPDYKADDSKNQRLEIHAKVNDIAEAQFLAEKKLRYHNKYEKICKFTLPGTPELVAGVCVTLANWGPWSGKYIIKEARHTYRRSGGYETQITLRRILGGY